jgi:hypothetical protein
MKGTFLPITDAILVGDFNPWPIYQATGSVAIAGIFLSLAIISGGMWLVRRSRNRPTSSVRRWL